MLDCSKNPRVLHPPTCLLRKATAPGTVSYSN